MVFFMLCVKRCLGPLFRASRMGAYPEMDEAYLTLVAQLTDVAAVSLHLVGIRRSVNLTV
jgi:hypothetical protein